MPKSKKEDKTEMPVIEIDKENIVSLRKTFFVDFDNLEEQKEAYDLDFVNRLKHDDDLLGRFLWHHHGNVTKAFEQLKDVAKWRKEFEVKELKLSSLNKEIINTSGLYQNKCDHNGDPILLLAVNRVTRNTEQNPDKQKIVVWLAETILSEAPNGRLTFFLDCQGVGVSNMDLEMMVFITNCLLKYYPDSIGYVLVYNMPFLFNVIWQVIKALLPKQYKSKVKFVDKDSVLEYVNPECLPKRMGGMVPDYYNFDTQEFYDKS